MDDLIRGADKFGPDAGDSGAAHGYRPLASGELRDSWRLDEFFGALGPVMRLPPKDAPEGSPRIPPARSRRTRSHRLVLLAMTLLAGVAGFGPIWALLHPSEPMPSGLVGVWRTQAARYAGRAFALSDTTLRLEVGNDGVTYRITEMHRGDSTDAAIYMLRYRDGETTQEFSFAIGSDSTIRIKHLPDVSWYKFEAREPQTAN